jgi:Flp pilus assembly protein protease CpaA
MEFFVVHASRVHVPQALPLSLYSIFIGGVCILTLLSAAED